MHLITIRGGGYIAHICPEKGANCLRLTHEKTGAELLRTPLTDEEFYQRSNVYGMPLLFPPNRILDGHYQFNGRTYEFPINEPARHHHIHGCLHATPFSVEEHKENYARLSYHATQDQPYLQFPHAFSVTLEYSVDENGLHQKLIVTNCSDSPMPFGAGFHTALPVPFMPGGDAGDCVLSVTAGKQWMYNDRIIPTGEVQSAECFRQGMPAAHHVISAHMDMGKSGGTAILSDRKSGAKIVYEVSEGYRFWMLFNEGGEKGYICPEPQSWMVDAPNRPFGPEITGFDAIAPGDKRILTANLRLEV